MRLPLLFLAVGLLLSSTPSFDALAQPRARATVFREQDFRGDRRQLDGPVRDFSAIGLNDRVSSIRIDSGIWQFCEDANFQGRCFTLRRDERNLAGSGMDDRISSARPVMDRDNRGGGFSDRGQGRDGGGAVVLYADVGFRGPSRESGDSRDFRSLDFNDTVSSIRIRSGTWQFCEDADFRGRCITADRDIPDLVPSGMNDKISSMRRVR